MKTYLRTLGFLRPHLHVFVLAVGATFLFAAFDAFSIVLLIPFLATLFSGQGEGGLEGSQLSGAERAGEGTANLLDRSLYANVGRFIDPQGDP